MSCSMKRFRTMVSTVTSNNRIADLIAERRPGYSLPQAFYRDPEIFELDLERIFRRYWIPAGPLARIPEEGKWFLFSLGSDSIIIARDSDGAVHAMHNVCRHRGSEVCYEEEGRGKALVCPYHAWAYGLDGSLVSARAMGPDFDKSE